MSRPSFCTAPRVVVALLTLVALLTNGSAEAVSRRGGLDVRWLEGTVCFGLPRGELRRLKGVVDLQSVSIYESERSKSVPIWLDDYPGRAPRSLDPAGCLRYGDAQGNAAHKPVRPLRVGVPYEVFMNISRTQGRDPTQFHSARFCLFRQRDGSTGLMTLKYVEDKGWNTWACGAP